MADPNSVPVSVAAATAIVIPAPGAVTTLQPPPPYALGFIRVLGLDLSNATTSTVTIFSSGGSFPDRTLDTIQIGAGGPISKTSGKDGIYSCDPGAALKITNSAGTLTGSITYTVLGAG